MRGVYMWAGSSREQNAQLCCGTLLMLAFLAGTTRDDNAAQDDSVAQGKRARGPDTDSDEEHDAKRPRTRAPDDDGNEEAMRTD
jgi:hypothetical protein